MNEDDVLNGLFIKGIRIDWDRIDRNDYIRDIPAIRTLKELEFDSGITFFTGENGTGKSTLLEAMAVAAGFNPEGGTRNYSFSTYDDYSSLHDATTLIRGIRKARSGYFLRAESFFNVATKEEEYSKGSDAIPLELHQKSHGESFLEIAQNYFHGNGLYFLDEPEAALSPQRQLTLLMSIYQAKQNGAQFFIVTHSPILLGMPDVKILNFDDGAIAPVAYEDTGSYQVMELFINHREKILKDLLEEE